MALTGTDEVLAGLIVQYVQAESVAAGLKPPMQIEPFAKGIARAILEHLVLNAEVAPGILVATSGGAGATTEPGLIT